MICKASKQAFQWNDPLSLEGQITADERAVRDTAHDFCQEQLLPHVLEAFRHEKTDVGVFRGMGELGLLGATIPEDYGGAGLNYVCYGLIAREVERVDSGYRSMMSVQSSLVMVPINEFGNEPTKQKYLPKLATGEWIGCFGLTEPNHGSDPDSISRAPGRLRAVIASPVQRCGSQIARSLMCLSSGRRTTPATSEGSCLRRDGKA